jgi:inner membrane transporter RhtA
MTFNLAFNHSIPAGILSGMETSTADRPVALRASLATRFTMQTPPHVFFVGSAVFHYLGPAFAVLLFAHVAPLGVAWLRIASAAVVFAVWRRPWRYLRTLDVPALLGSRWASFSRL